MSRTACILPFPLLLFVSGMAQENWQLQNANFPAGVSVVSLSAVDNQTCWAAGIIHTSEWPGTRPYPGFSRTTDGGKTWVCDSIPGALEGQISQLVALDTDTAYAAVFVSNGSNAKGVYKTTDGGATWTKQNAFSSSLYGPGYIHFFDANNGVAIGDPNLETYTTTNGGLNWDPVSMPATLSDEYTWISGCSITGVGNRAWFGSTKRIFRTTDRGRTWLVSGPSYDYWYPVIAFQDSNTGIYCLSGTIPTHVYRKTTDGGATWNDLADPVISGIAASCIRHVPGTTGTYVIAGGFAAGGGFACTYDGGEDWTSLGTTGYLIVEFPSTNTGWASPQLGNTVYRYVGAPLAIEGAIATPDSYVLEQNYPNPFNPATTIRYTIPGTGCLGHEAGRVRLSVYDLLGREVALLVNERETPGRYEISFNGSRLASGTYLYRLEAGQSVTVRRMILVK